MGDQLRAFNEEVLLKFQLYNSLFLTLPFPDLYKIGVTLPVFNAFCHKKIAEKSSPKEIIDDFFKEYLHRSSLEYRLRVIKIFSQLIERQVCLYDALDDAAFAKTHDLSAYGSIDNLLSQAKQTNKTKKLAKILNHYKTKIVLTAHPTQFYPPQILSIIHDLTKAVKNNENEAIRNILLQLGKTSFSNQRQPSPLDEAKVLITQLCENFYPVIRDSYFNLHQGLKIPTSSLTNNFEIGFWPGGDRDGNPNVTAKTTVEVAHALKTNILRLYIHEIRNLRKRLTFPGIWQQLNKIEKKIQNSFTANNKENYPTAQAFLADIVKIRREIVSSHQSLFVNLVDKLIAAIICFGFHFATIDLRQNSKTHHENLMIALKLIQKTRINKQIKTNIQNYSNTHDINSLNKLIASKITLIDLKKLNKAPILIDIIQSLQNIKLIQKNNGTSGLSRYIISNSSTAQNILELILLAKIAGLNTKKLNFDIVPLFESVDDLQNAENIMQQLFENPVYKMQLKHRKNKQTIMLGFSDGTKDGGYLTANWEILKAKIRLAQLAKQYKIEINFFDGRGGPPARGGGNTHKFYQALEADLHQNQIELTIQGQTISSKFGTYSKAKYNLEQLFTSGLYNKLAAKPNINPITKTEFELLETLSKYSLNAYLKLKNHPLFVDYLEEATTLNFFGKLNIASRPARRKANKSFEDLRAIPFVSAWTQMKQNVPGFYGLGSALQKLSKRGRQKDLVTLYKNNLFFHTLIENTIQSLAKTNFELTAYLKNDKKFKPFWDILHQEYLLTVKILHKITGHKNFLENDPITQKSIALREDLVFPLLVIQQAALINLRKIANKNKKTKAYQFYENIILKTLAAIINAGRNAV